MAMATCEHSVSTTFASDGATRRRVGGIGELLALVARWSERSAQRRRLLQLDDHQLRDIGLTRADIEKEASKPFWAA